MARVMPFFWYGPNGAPVPVKLIAAPILATLPPAAGALLAAAPVDAAALADAAGFALAVAGVEALVAGALFAVVLAAADAAGVLGAGLDAGAVLLPPQAASAMLAHSVNGMRNR